MNGLKVKYTAYPEFQAELTLRVNQYFDQTGIRRQDVPQVYLKTFVLLLWLALSYVLLVFVAWSWWQAVPLAASLGLAMAGIGFNIQHDGSHRAYSRFPLINRLTAMSLDLVGGSSYIWRWKHNQFHHSYPNIAGADEDIDLVPFAHLAPEQPRYAVHRFQHLYVWALYCLLPLQWHFVSDFRNLIRGTIGGHSFSRPRVGELFLLLGGKIVFFGLAFVLPAFFHSWWKIALCYGLTAAVLGLTLSIVFQLAHCVEEASFSQPIAGTNRMQNSWMVHQIESSVDFGRSNKLLTWYLGGLNFQIEHHLFPTICHFHYPALSPIVEAICGEFDVRYFAHDHAYEAVASHYRFLKLDRS